MAQGMDFCDLVTKLRPFFHPKDRDISLLVGREIYVPDPDDPGDPDKPPTIPPIPVTGGVVPVGGIIGWSGALVDVPIGWQLCDGTNGTPDSRNVFIMGAGDTYNPGDTGGAATVDISHTHTDTFAVDNDTHNHSDTFTIDNDTHDHADTFTTNNDAHTHSSDTLATTGADTFNADGFYFAEDIPSGIRHRHEDLTGSTDSDTHNHGISGSVSNDTHNHAISGSVSNDTHNHNLSGLVSSGGSAALNIINPYIAWGWIQRMS